MTLKEPSLSEHGFHDPREISIIVKCEESLVGEILPTLTMLDGRSALRKEEYDPD